ncbi:MAG: dTDP-4-dehydrorhamnose reductase [Paludibacteraceae bacterium]|nr:dTDP-4-dehydrorhamnose reductase [Paludibacteraceae bacterium]
MNILVTGADGQLGNEMRILGKNSPHNYIFTDVNELDITYREAIRKLVAEQKIDVIVNCAAYTNVDKAEDDQETAYFLNARAVENLAFVAKEFDVTLFHISTDYVFSGKNSVPYTEDDDACPIGVYGKTKLQGEEAILLSGCKYIIIRTSWLYSEFGRNFVKTMLPLTVTKPELKVVFDQVGSPTYAFDLAKVICQIIDSRGYEENNGIYHFSNEGVCSWYDFAKSIANFSKHLSCEIFPCHSSEFPSKVTRPSFSVLDKTKIKNTFGLTIPHWQDSLKECLEKMRALGE